MDQITFWLPVIWIGILGFAIALYIILDGFDLGIGILFPFGNTEEGRDQMMNTIAPFWDGNETWLVLGGGGLWIAFGKAIHKPPPPRTSQVSLPSQKGAMVFII